jgi:hypothetical protein
MTQDSETDIVQLSKDFMASQVEELFGDEDPRAFQVVRADDDTLGIALVDIPVGPDDRDKMADYLTATCCVHRATEATFSSAAWSSVYSDVADAEKALPAQRPNRVEIIMLVHVTSAGVETHTAAVLRVDGRVRLSPWITDKALGEYANGGRIPEALKWGIKLVNDMPEELVVALGRAKEALPMGRVVEMFVRQIRGIRQHHLAPEQN